MRTLSNGSVFTLMPLALHLLPRILFVFPIVRPPSNRICIHCLTFPRTWSSALAFFRMRHLYPSLYSLVLTIQGTTGGYCLRTRDRVQPRHRAQALKWSSCPAPLSIHFDSPSQDIAMANTFAGGLPGVEAWTFPSDVLDG
jgi:hypothetical protein